MNEETNEIETTANAELDAVRQVVLAAYPDSVPELIRGETVPELLASIEPARAAYARVAETVGAAAEPVACRAGGAGGGRERGDRSGRAAGGGEGAPGDRGTTSGRRRNPKVKTLG